MAVIIRPLGGLGNQRFTYAAGRSLASRLGVELHANTQYLQSDKKRKFGLDTFRSRLDRVFDSNLNKAAVGTNPLRILPKNFAVKAILLFSQSEGFGMTLVLTE